MADLKIIERFTKPMKMLGDAELGRLVHAMLDYLVDGTDTDLRGNERFLWDDAKASIDRQKRIRKANSDGGKKGMESRWNKSAISPNKSNISVDKSAISPCEKEKNQKKGTYSSTPYIESSNALSEEETQSSTMRSNSTTAATSDASSITEKQKAIEAQENESRMFDAFWDEYPRRQDKAKAKTAFHALHVTDDLFDRIMDGLRRQKATAQWQNPKYIPLPTTWLHGRRWEDELPKEGVADKQDDGYDNLRRLYAKYKTKEEQNAGK